MGILSEALLSENHADGLSVGGATAGGEESYRPAGTLTVLTPPEHSNGVTGEDRLRHGRARAALLGRSEASQSGCRLCSGKLWNTGGEFPTLTRC